MIIGNTVHSKTHQFPLLQGDHFFFFRTRAPFGFFGFGVFVAGFNSYIFFVVFGL